MRESLLDRPGVAGDARRDEACVDQNAVHPDGVPHPNTARKAEHDREHRVLKDDEGGDCDRGGEC
ncbi:MAG TPA: hypothetical protein VK273_02475 [Gaiellaceae bacterium]|nr:hypothetical protein [Gaiellaceae bacterium]